MPYLIDSDWVIDHLANVPQAVELLNSFAPEGIAISIITYMEVYEGILKIPTPEAARQKLQAFLQNVPILPFTLEVAERCAQLRERLRQQRLKVNRRAMDLMIAATALEYGLTLVTRNYRDYANIPDLTIHSIR